MRKKTWKQSKTLARHSQLPEQGSKEVRPNWSLFVLQIIILLPLGCSLNIDNPLDDARKQINNPVELDASQLIGVWKSEKQNAPVTGAQSVLQDVSIEFLRDNSFQFKDIKNNVFENFIGGRAALVGDSLRIWDQENVLIHVFHIKLTFFGSFLILVDRKTKREATFSRLFSYHNDTLSAKLQLKEPYQFWQAIGGRSIKSTIPISDSLSFKEDFLFLNFTDDSLIIEKNHLGFVTILSGTYNFQNDTLSIKMTSGTHQFAVDARLWSNQIRLWPLKNSDILKLDELSNTAQSYYVFTPVYQKHSNARNLNQFVGYWRGDIINNKKNHYGNYYDIEISNNGAVQTFTNDPEPIVFKNWGVVDGKFLLSLDASSPLPTTINFNDSNIVQLTNTMLWGTFEKMDRSEIQKNPLSRFSNRSYLHIHFLGDTLKFYNEQKIILDTLDIFKIEFSNNKNKTFSGFTIKKPSEQSQSGFHSAENRFGFAFESINNGDKIVTYNCDTSGQAGMRIRTWATKMTNIYDGAFSSGVVTNAAGEKFSISGTFRFDVNGRSSINHSFWEKFLQKR